MRIRAAIILLSFLGATTPAMANRGGDTQTLAACATFGPDGNSIGATIDASGLSVEITTPVGRVSHLNLPLRHPVDKTQIENRATRFHLDYSCQAYVDHAGGLVAIGITSGGPTRRLRVAVANLRTSQWIGDWAVERRARLVPPSLAGFLQDTDSVVVAGEPPSNDGLGTHWGLLGVTVFDQNGKKLMPQRIIRYATDGSLIPRYVDARHNRLWIIRCEPVSGGISRQPGCPVAWVSLTGDKPYQSEFAPPMQGKKRKDFWLLPNTFAATDPNTIVIGEGHTVWRVDLKQRTVERLHLPIRVHFPNIAQIFGGAASSPDEEVIAVPILRNRLAFPFLLDNFVFQGTDIGVIQLHPFQFLGVLPHRPNVATFAFAVDHRQGKTTVLVYRQDHWERHEMSKAVHP